MKCGIYCIINNENKKRYIGQSIHIGERYREHWLDLKRNAHDNRFLQEDWNKYGAKAFSFIVLELCTPDRLNEKELYWIGIYNSTDRGCGYNIQKGGSHKNKGKQVKVDKYKNRTKYKK